MAAANSIPLPEGMKVSGDWSSNWNNFRAEFEDYSLATGLHEKPTAVQAATLRMVMGSECRHVYKHSLNLTEEQEKDTAAILNALEGYFRSAKNVIYERYIFGSCKQREGESIENFVTRLREKAATCEYGPLQDELIRDKIVLGITSESTRLCLLRERSLKLNAAIEICRTAELADKQMRTMEPDWQVDRVNAAVEQQRSMYGYRSKQQHNSLQSSSPAACSLPGQKEPEALHGDDEGGDPYCESPDSGSQDYSDSESDSDIGDRSRNQKAKQQPCKYYNTGSCRKGQSCEYLHVCQFYIRGNCRNGGKCKYSHGGAAELDSPERDYQSDDGNKPQETYQWQVCKGKTWLNINHDWVIEAQYSQPSAAGIKIYNTKFGAFSIDFNRMKVRGKELGVRRIPGKDDCWVWYCRCDSQWNAYGEKDSQGNCSDVNSADIEAHYHRDSRGTFHFMVGQKPYQIEFSRMKQLNVSTGTHRTVRSRPKFVGPKAVSVGIPFQTLSVSGKPVWQFLGDNGQWHDFKKQKTGSVSSDQIESQYQQNPRGSMTYSKGNQKYSLDFSAMCQTNVLTGTTRKVQRLQGHRV